MEPIQLATLSVAAIAVVLSLLTLLSNRGDKSEQRFQQLSDKFASHVREFDQFKGEASSTYATPEDVKEAVAIAIKPLEKEVERLIDESRKIGVFLERLAAQTHINTVSHS